MSNARGYALMIVMVMMTVLSFISLQSHHLVVSQLASLQAQRITFNKHWVHSCVAGECKGAGWSVSITPLFESASRQYFNAAIEACNSQYCNQYRQVFSRSSAIFIEELDWHAYQQLE